MDSTKSKGDAPDPIQDPHPANQVTEKNDPQATDEDLAQEAIAEALRNYVPGSEEEKRLVRKVDFILLPVLWWMYILAYIDRGNIVSSMLSRPDLSCPNYPRKLTMERGRRTLTRPA